MFQGSPGDLLDVLRGPHQDVVLFFADVIFQGLAKPFKPASCRKNHAGHQDVVLFFADVIFPGPGTAVQVINLFIFSSRWKGHAGQQNVALVFADVIFQGLEKQSKPTSSRPFICH